MTLDIRGLPYVDAFKQVKEAVSRFHTHDEDVIVFVDADELEKCTIMKGFADGRNTPPLPGNSGDNGIHA